MNVLMSGYRGFVGTNLIAYTKDNWNITGITRHRQENDILPDVMTWKDVSGAGLPDVATVVHLAGKAHDMKGVSQPAAYFEANTYLTQELFDKFLQSDATCFIYCSSVKAAADKVEGVLTENVDPKPLTAYGKSKQMAEAYLLQQNLPQGKSLYILRPCMIHGPGNKGNLNLLYNFVQRGIPYPLHAFHNKRSFLSVHNLCYIISTLAANAGNIPSGIYHLADDEALSTNELMNIMGEVTGKNIRKWNLPPSLIKKMARLGDYLHLPLNSDRLQKLTESYEVSNEKIKNALLLRHMPVTARDGLVATIQSFQST
ncbi:NAD-dependent epimerase/dehydratase family protein [Chitinophaga sp. Cy-1792]|nr:NAD-dependent epimerase/dehydratase family protein [Chitinophaga sp. Cy-1792]